MDKTAAGVGRISPRVAVLMLIQRRKVTVKLELRGERKAASRSFVAWKAADHRRSNTTNILRPERITSVLYEASYE